LAVLDGARILEAAFQGQLAGNHGIVLGPVSLACRAIFGRIAGGENNDDG
jgi:hypothetical protein